VKDPDFGKSPRAWFANIGSMPPNIWRTAFSGTSREQKLFDSQEILFADSLDPYPCFQVTEREFDAIALQV